jgi:hypothetical protein
MRSAAAIVVAPILAALLGLAAAALSNERSQAFTLGVVAAMPTKIKPGQAACQLPITVPANGAFDGVTLAVGTRRRPGPPLDVSVRSVETDAEFAGRPEVRSSGTVAAGYRGLDAPTTRTVWMARVPSERVVEVCVSNRGRRNAFIFGAEDAAARSSLGTIDGKPAYADFALMFERREARSVAELLPAMLHRAALFRARLVGPWTYVLLAGLVLLVVPALLARAVTLAAREGA